MAVLKRCTCPTKPRCDHDWHIQLNLRRNGAGRPERGPVREYAFLLQPGQLLPVTKTEARELELRVRTWVLSGRPAPAAAPNAEPAPGLTIGTAADAYLRQYVAARLHDGSTDVWVVEQIQAAVGRRPLADLLDRAVVRGFLTDQQAKAAANPRGKDGRVSYNRALARWSHFSNWCRIEFGLAGESPFYHKSLRPQGLKPYKEGSRHRRLDPDEDQALLSALTAYATTDGGVMLGRYYAALDACLRRGEMLKLRRRDGIVRDGAELYLRILHDTSKSGTGRLIAVASDRLRAFLETRRFSEYPFGQHDGSPISVNQFEATWVAMRTQAGLDTGAYKKLGGRYRWTWTKKSGLTWHDLRHEGASRLLESRKVDIREIQRILGHSSLDMTEKYLNPKPHATAVNMRAAMVAMGL